MAISAQLKGRSRFKRSLRKYEKRVERAVRDEIDATTKKVNNKARDFAPEITGNLVQRMQTWISSTGLHGVVFNDAEYAARVEWGFHGRDRLGRLYNQPGQHYMRRAFQREAPGISRRIKQRL